MATPSKDDWELWGAITVVVAFLLWPAKWLWNAAVIGAVDARRKDLKQIVNEIYADEIKQREATATLAEKNADILVSQEASIAAFGVAMRDLPSIKAALTGMTDAVRELKDAVGNLNENMLEHGTELGRVSGFLESGQWRGPERRKKGRRQDDPPLTDGST